MSLFATIESWFTGIEADINALLQGATTINNAAGVVLGQVESAAPIIALVDPPLAAAVTAGAAAAAALNTVIGQAITTLKANTTTAPNLDLPGQIAELTSHLVTLSVQTAPFINVVAKDAAAIDTNAVAAAKAASGIPVPAPVA
jgi:hypothetical protein